MRFESASIAPAQVVVKKSNIVLPIKTVNDIAQPVNIEVPVVVKPVANSTEMPSGVAKSGRIWKHKQLSRSSTQKRQGVMALTQCKTYEERKAIREHLDEARNLEREMKEEKKAKKVEARMKREEKEKRRALNELKSASYQTINANKIKGMSKKQLRSIKKTTVNKHGVVELVSPWGASK